MICPKCRREYANEYLASYSRYFASAAKSFKENNKIITHCENCKKKLIKEDIFNKSLDENDNYLPEHKKFLRKLCKYFKKG